jgi:hypothetical protein
MPGQGGDTPFGVPVYLPYEPGHKKDLSLSLFFNLLYDSHYCGDILR